MENKLHKGNGFIVQSNILRAEILVGGLEAQLPFSVEGINILEGLHNKAKGTASCHLKPSIYNCL